MATTGRTRKPKSVLDRELHTAEFTSGQLVIAICGLLIAALLCFLLGVLVGRYERNTEDRMLVQQIADESATPDLAQQTPKTVPAPAPAPAPTSAPPPARPQTPPPAPPTPPAEPPARETAPAESVPAPQAQPREEEPPILIAPLPDPPARPTPPPAPAAPPPAPRPEPTPSAGPRYGIQVAAFGDAANAQRALQRLKENAELEADLVQSGQWVRIVVGNYARREDADRALEQLRQRAGFRDSYVVERPD